MGKKIKKVLEFMKHMQMTQLKLILKSLEEKLNQQQEEGFLKKVHF